jgi:hypothetical protein
VSARRKPKVNTNCVADVYAEPTEKIVELSIPGQPDCGALLSLRNDGERLHVVLYNVDQNVVVHQPTALDGEGRSVKVELFQGKEG